MLKFRTANRYVFNDEDSKTHVESYDQKNDLTIPGQSMSIPEILVRFQAGITSDQLKPHFDVEDPDHDDLDIDQIDPTRESNFDFSDYVNQLFDIQMNKLRRKKAKSKDPELPLDPPTKVEDLKNPVDPKPTE